MTNFRYHIIIFFLKAIAFLPLSVLYIISDIICFVLHRIVGYRVEVVRRNLRNSFPEKTPEELKRYENKYYRHMCDCIVETIKLLHISDKEIRQRVEIHNTELVEKIASDKRQIILFMGHCGNWEWVPAVTMALDKPQVMGALYRPVKDKAFDRVMLRIRSRFNSECIPMRRAYRRLVELNRDDKTFMMGFIADQRPTGVDQNHRTMFLNQVTSYLVGGETIGRKINAEYVYADIERLKRGHYSLTFRKIEVSADDSAEYPYTLQFLKMLEETIRKAPEFWLWSHNRWKA